jgi:hypothetical protein
VPLNDDQRNRITEIVKKILLSRTDSFPTDNSTNRNAPFHDAFLSAFEEQLRPHNIPTPKLVAIASWLHGLSTSLGSGFESIAHVLGGGYKRQFTNQYTLEITKAQSAIINGLINKLKREGNPDLETENAAIFADEVLAGERENALGFTADIYREAGTLIEAIEMKSVRPNSGEGRGEKAKILNAKAAFKLISPGKDIKYFVGFPFDPTSPTPTGFDKDRFFNYLVEFKKFFSPDEILIGSELWDHLSGQENTMDSILNIIKDTVSVFANRSDK